MKREEGQRKMINKEFQNYREFMLKAIEFIKIEDKKLLAELRKR